MACLSLSRKTHFLLLSSYFISSAIQVIQSNFEPKEEFDLVLACLIRSEGHSVNIWVFCDNELVATIECLLKFLVFVVWHRNQDARSWSFGFASFANFSSALHVDVGDVFFFTEDWQVA